jgi:elongation factor P
VTYMMEGLVVEVLKHGQDILGVEIPKTMTLTVTQTDPGTKGNTVQGGTKPATLESGAVVVRLSGASRVVRGSLFAGH